MVITQNSENVDFREKSLLLRLEFPNSNQAKFFVESLGKFTSEEQRKVIINLLEGKAIVPSCIS